MGTITIKKYQNTNEKLTKCYGKWYGKVLHRGTMGTDELANHIMKHGSVYTDDVVLGVTRKLMHCIAEQLAEGYKEVPRRPEQEQHLHRKGDATEQHAHHEDRSRGRISGRRKRKRQRWWQ